MNQAVYLYFVLPRDPSITPGPISHIKQDMMSYPQMSSPGPPSSRQVSPIDL